MSSRKNFGYIGVFSVKQLGNNDASGNKETAVYFKPINFNGICHSTKYLLN